MLKRVLLWAPPILYMALIFHLSSESAPVPEVTAVVWDKLLHLSGYALLGALLFRAFDGEGVGWVPASLLALIVASLYGASDEWHQWFVPLRDADIRDWVADTLGAALGVAAYAFFHWRRGLASAKASAKLAEAPSARRRPTPAAN